MILISHRTDYPPRIRIRKGETIREEINLTPLLNDRDDTIDSVSWESDSSSDISVSAHASDSYTATPELTANSEGCANIMLTVTTTNGQTIKQTIRAIAYDPERCAAEHGYQ